MPNVFVDGCVNVRRAAGEPSSRGVRRFLRRDNKIVTNKHCPLSVHSFFRIYKLSVVR
jgi:hypothetical protein